MVICLELGADLHMAQLMPLPLTASCFSKIQIGFTFLVPAHPGSPGQRAVKRVCVCVCVCHNMSSCLLVEIQPMKYLFGGFKNLVGIVCPVWVALECQVHQCHLQGDNVLRWHVWTILQPHTHTSRYIDTGLVALSTQIRLYCAFKTVKYNHI